MLVKESRLIEDEPGHFIEDDLYVDKRSLWALITIVLESITTRYLGSAAVNVICIVHLIIHQCVLIHRFLLLDESNYVQGVSAKKCN